MTTPILAAGQASSACQAASPSSYPTSGTGTSRAASSRTSSTSPGSVAVISLSTACHAGPTAAGCCCCAGPVTSTAAPGCAPDDVPIQTEVSASSWTDRRTDSAPDPAATRSNDGSNSPRALRASWTPSPPPESRNCR
ncbi:hypothetical protein Francci3_0109 [Frankia casuarinae]|uniref:Uncharacterized protein n=1 Tax=Frankia casuarinae (strain DSM 45818 / CECT 9043 / HFP020203 / CcI3) TaxID=106370 RepID=Q2JGT9_FRACC|nr:hypothetical protein Francci3_0109 [Frankia casuarinae]